MANGGNPNTYPKCGSQISIHNPTSGQTHQATVVDTCQACAMHDIDVTESLFLKLAGGLSAGRVPVEWGMQSSLWLGIIVCGGADYLHSIPRVGTQGQRVTEELLCVGEASWIC